MSRRRTRRRRGHVRTTIRDIVLLIVFCVVVWVAGHLLAIAVVAAIGAGAFWGVRRLRGRRRPRTGPGRTRARQDPRRTPAATVPFPAVSAGPDPADQIRQLEAVTGRPIETVIESYRLIQSKYNGGQP